MFTTTITTIATNLADDGETKRQKIDDESHVTTRTVEGRRYRLQPSTTVAAENVKPTDEEISLALCAIDDTDNRYSLSEVKKAFNNLYNWRRSKNKEEAGRIADAFVDREGIRILLDFMNENRNDVVLAYKSAYVLTTFLDTGKNDCFLDRTKKFASKFVNNDGVELLLGFIAINLVGCELDIRNLRTLNNFWHALGRIVYNTNKTDDDDDDTVDNTMMDKLFPIIDSGILTLNGLGKIWNHPKIVTAVKIEIMMTFTLIVENYERMDLDEFHEKNIFRECVRALKDPLDDDSWNYDKLFGRNAVWFFRQCCYSCSSSSNKTNNGTSFLFKQADFESIIPFVIQFIEKDPSYSFQVGAFDILRKASDTLDKETVLKSHGLLVVLGTIADGGNIDVKTDVKENAIKLMKHLLR